MIWLKYIKDRLQGKAPKGVKRSSKWKKVRKEFLKKNSKCVVCGSTKKLEVHHKVPFSVSSDLELEEKNLIVLCENGRFRGINCHLMIGHLLDYKRYNINVEIDAMIWNKKLSG